MAGLAWYAIGLIRNGWRIRAVASQDAQGQTGVSASSMRLGVGLALLVAATVITAVSIANLAA
jgi:hypothetical protein